MCAALAQEQGVAVLSIKSMSLGGWPTGVERSRKWWYRSVEEPQDVSLAVRFALSQPNVVAAIPPSYLDLLDKAIDAAHELTPITESEVQQLSEMAQAWMSIFQKDEAQAMRHHAPKSSLCQQSPRRLLRPAGVN